jgi:hypothetical protein
MRQMADRFQQGYPVETCFEKKIKEQAAEKAINDARM